MGHALARDNRIESGLLQKRVLKILVSLLVHLNIYQLLCNRSHRGYILLQMLENHQFIHVQGKLHQLVEFR